MRLAILGAGNLGTALAKRLIASGHSVTLSFSLDPAKLASTAAALGASEASPAQATRNADVVVLAMPWGAVKDATKAAGALNGKIVWDCTVPLKADLSGLEIGCDSSAGEEVARLASGAEVIKAVPPPAEWLHAAPAPAGDRRPSVFLCGGSGDAKRVVSDLVSAIGADPVDAGPLTSARYTEPLIMLIIQLAYGQKLGGKIGLSLVKYA